jgi:hypothetical protein
MKETKAFYKTSEFWLMVLGQLVMILQYVNVWTLFHGKWSFLAPLVQTALAYAYIQSRGHAKSGVPIGEDDSPLPEPAYPDTATGTVVQPGTNLST